MMHARLPPYRALLLSLAPVLAMLCHAHACQAQSLIPSPSQLRSGTGVFTLGAQAEVAADPAAAPEAARLATALGLPLRQRIDAQRSQIVLRLQPGRAGQSDEGYRLAIEPRRVELVAASAAGLYYGCQTLQALVLKGEPASLPVLGIEDAPRFAHRGLMIDVARHFFSTQVLMRILDEMGQLKLNVLHLHLTDDTGWRVPIPAYPRLIEFGAQGDIEHPGAVFGAAGGAAGGKAVSAVAPQFYSAAELVALVVYARARHIEIVPEIEFPGHSGAAARAYPELFDAAGAINPGKPESYRFIEAVFTEVARIFPSRSLHFGGDEVQHDAWATVPEVIRLQRELGLPDMKSVEGYFDQQVARIIASLGRTAVAWDEAYSAGVPASVTIQWWRKNEPEVRDAAIRAGHSLILSPVDQVYFDYPQGLGEPGAPWEGNDNGPTSIDKLLRWQPVPAGYSAAEGARIQGLEAALWTEFIRSESYLEYMLYARLAAFAEVAWHGNGERDATQFRLRLAPRLQALRERGMHVRRGADDAVEFQTH